MVLLLSPVSLYSSVAPIHSLQQFEVVTAAAGQGDLCVCITSPSGETYNFALFCLKTNRQIRICVIEAICSQNATLTFAWCWRRKLLLVTTGSKVKAHVLPTQQGYLVNFTPTELGEYLLNIQFGGQDLAPHPYRLGLWSWFFLGTFQKSASILSPYSKKGH